MGKKAPSERLYVAYILPCEIEPALIVGCDAIEMRDLDVDLTVLKVVLRPARGRLSRRIPIDQIPMIDSAGVYFAVASSDGVTRATVVPDSLGRNAYPLRDRVLVF